MSAERNSSRHRNPVVSEELGGRNTETHVTLLLPGYYHENLEFTQHVCLLMKRGVSPHSVELHNTVSVNFDQKINAMGDTLLHVAARYGSHEWVEVFIVQDPRLLTAQNKKGDTALHIAARGGYVPTLKRLLDAHFRSFQCQNSEISMEAVNKTFLVKNNQGNTFLHEALFNRHEGVMKLVLSDELEYSEPGFKKFVERVVVVQTNKENKSVLYLAIEAGYKELFVQALAILYDHNHPQPELAELIPLGPGYVPPGKPLLLAAILKRDQDILDIILQKKQDWIHLTDEEGRIPLHYAASVGYLDGVQKLLGKSACAFTKDQYGFFPLHLASDGGHVEVVQKLLEVKYCPYPSMILDNAGRNILHLAIESGKFNVVRYILQSKDPELRKMINDQDANGNTPLHLASLCFRSRIVQALTWDQRVDLTLVNNMDQTALDACNQFPIENPSLRQWLTRVALKSAGVGSAQPQHSPLVPSETTERNQYKDRIDTLLRVSTLIITATFTAGFTMPGGTNNSDPGEGMAILLNRIWFKLFIFCMAVSMYGAICATIILIWAQLGDITLAFLALKVAMPLLGVTLATLSLAFLAGIHLVISDLSWLATTFLVMCVIFIIMLLLLYTLLWFPSSSSIAIVRYISYYPFLFLASLADRDDTSRIRNHTDSTHSIPEDTATPPLSASPTPVARPSHSHAITLTSDANQTRPEPLEDKAETQTIVENNADQTRPSPKDARLRPMLQNRAEEKAPTVNAPPRHILEDAHRRLFTETNDVSPVLYP